MAVRIDLPPAWKRVPYYREYAFIGRDWSAGVLRAEFRKLPGSAGDPLFSLERVADDSEGLTATLRNDFPIPGTSLTIIATVLGIRIAEATLEALTANDPSFSPLTLYYDVHVGNLSIKEVAMFGVLPVNPGVTQ